MTRDYRTFMLSDEPKIAGIPLATGLPVFLLTGVGMLTGFVSQLFLIGAVLSIVMHYKFGGLTMRALLSVVYWSLPATFTGMMFRAFPNSANRLFVR